MKKMLRHTLVSTICPILLASASAYATPGMLGGPVVVNQAADQDSSLQPQMNGYQSGPQYIKNKSLYHNQDINQAQDGVNLDSSQFGLNGPLSFTTTYSQNYGFILTGKYAQAFGRSNALGLEADAGSKQNRLNATWATVLSNKQRLKLSAEYLWQKINFNFDSGNVDQWVGQQAYGATYEYLVSHGLVQDFNFNTTYSKAQSDNLGEQDFDNGTMENFRNIAGGTDKSGSAGIDLSPFSSTLLGMQLNYDDLTYNTKYENNQNISGVGATLSLQQLITKRTKLQLTASDRKPAQEYTAEIDYLVHTRPGTSLQLGVLGGRNLGTGQLASDTRVGLNIAYSWGGDQDSPTSTYKAFSDNANNTDAVDAHQGLSNFAATPAVHMNQVYAIADQRSQNKTTGQQLGVNALPVYITPIDQGKAITTAQNFSTNTASTVDLGYVLNTSGATTSAPGLFTDARQALYPNMTIDMTDSYITDSTGNKTSELKFDVNSAGHVVITGTPTNTGTYTAYLYANATGPSGSTTSYAPTAANPHAGAQVITIKVTSGAPKFVAPSITAPAANIITVGQNWNGFTLPANSVEDSSGKPDTNYILKIVPNQTYSKDFVISGDNKTIGSADTSALKGLNTVPVVIQACNAANTAACSANETVSIPVNPPASFTAAGQAITIPVTVGNTFSLDVNSPIGKYITDPAQADGKTIDSGLIIKPVGTWPAGITAKGTIISGTAPATVGPIKLQAIAESAAGDSAPTTITVNVQSAAVPKFNSGAITAPNFTLDATKATGPAAWTLDLKSDITPTPGSSPQLLVVKNDNFTVSTNTPTVLTNKVDMPAGQSNVQVEACNILTPTPSQCSTPATVSVDAGYIDNFTSNSNLTAATAIYGAPYKQSIPFTDNNTTTPDKITIVPGISDPTQYGFTLKQVGNTVVIGGSPTETALQDREMTFTLTLVNQFGKSTPLTVNIPVVSPPTPKSLADTSTNIATPFSINVAEGFSQGSYDSTQTPVYAITKASASGGDFKQTTDVTSNIQKYLKSGSLDFDASAFPQGKAGEYTITIQAGLYDSVTKQTYYSSENTVTQKISIYEAPTPISIGPINATSQQTTIPLAFEPGYSTSATTYTAPDLSDYIKNNCAPISQKGKVTLNTTAAGQYELVLDGSFACSGQITETASNDVNGGAPVKNTIQLSINYNTTPAASSNPLPTTAPVNTTLSLDPSFINTVSYNIKTDSGTCQYDGAAHTLTSSVNSTCEITPVGAAFPDASKGTHGGTVTVKFTGQATTCPTTFTAGQAPAGWKEWDTTTRRAQGTYTNPAYYYGNGSAYCFYGRAGAGGPTYIVSPAGFTPANPGAWSPGNAPDQPKGSTEHCSANNTSCGFVHT